VDIIDYKKNMEKNINFVKYYGGKLPFKDNQFDATAALFVIHHTDDPEFYLKELIRVTKKNNNTL
jgi:ubiquinone/menaquinone biosynthesis C-methylase UbiE